MLSLKKYPLGEIHKGKVRNIFVARVEKNLPVHAKGICEEVLLQETKRVELYAITTEQRTLGYVIKFTGKPRVVHRWNYLYLFYGKKVSTRVKIEHQDSNIRLTRSGNENFVGLVLRSKTKAEDPVIPEEVEDD